jgi:hypothetical protein
VTGEVSDSEGERRLKLKVRNHVRRVHCIMVDKRPILKLILLVHHRPLNTHVHIRICLKRYTLFSVTVNQFFTYI